MLPLILALCEGNTPVYSPHEGPVMWSFDVSSLLPWTICRTNSPVAGDWHGVHAMPLWRVTRPLWRSVIYVKTMSRRGFDIIMTSWTGLSLVQTTVSSLRWRHNGCDGVSNHQPHDWLLNRLFRRRSKKTSKLRVTGLCAGNSPVSGDFPVQRARNAENSSIWWRHHVSLLDCDCDITNKDTYYSVKTLWKCISDPGTEIFILINAL